MQGQQQEQQLDPQLETQVSNPQDVRDLHRYGYRQVMRRSMGAFASFAVAYSMISITNAIYFLFPNVFQTIGGIGIWLWLPIAAGIFMIVLVYGHLAARMPVTGYAYQWNSRLLSSHYGWFTGWTAFLAFIAGTASIGTAFATVFAPDIWAKPTQGDIVLLAGVIIAVTTVINVASIRTVNAVNNAGVVFEFVGSILAAALLFVGALFFFHHTEGLKVLTQVGAAGGGKATGYGLALAALLPIYTLLGWEGSADLAEETNDPRAVTPHAMIRANYISVIASLFMIVGFAMAIPAGIGRMLGQPMNPLIYIFQSHFGVAMADVLQVVVFVAIFSCLLANMVVATRLTFSLSRDNMLPASNLLRRVHARTRTPIYAIVLVAVLAFAVNLLSSGIANNVVGIVNVSYYGTYVLTLIAVLIALTNGRVPNAPPGGFSLGRWIKPIAVGALVWALVVLIDMGGIAGGSTVIEYFAGAQALGILWYLLVLRRRITDRRAGVGREIDASPQGAAL